MNITKQRIIEIIKQEIEDAKQNDQLVPPEEDDQAVATRQDLGVLMIQAGKAIKTAQNITSAEAKLIEAFLDEIIEKANTEDAKTPLTLALKVIRKRLGTDK